MGAFFEVLSPSMIEWILEQHMFWVATAPLSGSGHVNVSPKGGKYFGVSDERTFWYQDLTGSGNETISHLHEPGNGRITILFNAFVGSPKILRLWGRGTVLESGSAAFEEHVRSHPQVELIPGTRSIIKVDVHQVGTSCGFSVPYYDFKEYRPILNDFFARKDEKFRQGDERERIDRYWAYKNAWSIDGLPGMKRGLQAAKAENIAPIKKMVGRLSAAPGRYKAPPRTFSMEHIVLVALSFFVLGVLVALHGPELLHSLPMAQRRQGGHALWGR